MIISARIDVTKIDKNRLFRGQKGIYLDVILIDKPDQYEHDGFIAQGVSKEERLAGVKGEILGSFKILSQKPKPPQQQFRKPEAPPLEDDQIPW